MALLNPPKASKFSDIHLHSVICEADKNVHLSVQ